MSELDDLLKKEGMLKCPIENTARVIEKRFTTLILRNMAHLNQTKFTQFLGSINGINPKTLSTRLQEMEKEGLICRNVFNEKPIRIEYLLTEKGRALEALLDQMASFSIKFCPADIFKDKKPRTFKQVYGKHPKVLQ